LAGEQWKISERYGATDGADGRVVATYPVQAFVFDGRLGDVFGYYVTADASEAGGGNALAVLLADRFRDAPHLVKNDGDRIEVKLTLTM
jgi:hypothetical protein